MLDWTISTLILGSQTDVMVTILKIRLNGEDRDVNDGHTVMDLILDLDLNPKGVAVERNLEIVPKSLRETTRLSEGDQIEIVEFVGGG